MQMSYKITIRNNETGEIVETDAYDFEFSEFWWLEGNMSCNCNRHLEWLRSVPGPRPEGDQHLNHVETMDCGDGAFSVLRATMDDGTVIELEK